MIWYLCAILSAILAGLSIPLIKLLLQDLHTLHLITFSMLGGMVVLWPVKFLIAPKKKPFHPKNKKAWGTFLLALFLGGALAPIVGVAGIERTSGVVSGLLFNLEIVFTFLLAAFIFREKLSRWAWLAVICMCTAGLLSVNPGGSQQGTLIGAFLIAFCCLLGALEVNLIKESAEGDPYTVAAAEYTVAASAAFIMVWILALPFPDWNSIIKAFLLGVGCFALSNLLYFMCLGKVGAGRTGTIFGAAPLIGSLSSTFILNEPWNIQILLGIGCVALGLGFLFVESKIDITSEKT